MNKASICCIAAFAVCGAVAVDEDNAERDASIPRMEWTARPNTQKGKIIFADTQSLPLQSGIVSMIQKLTRRHKYNMQYVHCATNEAPALKAKLRADILLAIVDDDTTPTALIALEDHWGVVNVGKIKLTLKTQEAKDSYLEGRCIKEILRVFSILCGGGSSQYQGNIFNCAKLDMLDYTDGMYPIDMQKKYHDYLSAIGVTPQVRVTYERACQEGWAPAPTNDVQKAIWDKVHAMPTEPLKIKPETKKQEK